MKPLISVIVPIYNVEKYLNICLETIVRQSYSNLEIILVDDGSPDSCPCICEEWRCKDKRIKVIHKENEGLGFARNSGLQVAQGDYVVFVDSDDYIDTSMIEKLYSALTSMNADTVYCQVNRLYPNGDIKKERMIYGESIFYNDEVVDKILLRMLGNTPEKDDGTYFYMSVWHAIYTMKIIKENKIQFPSERVWMDEDIAFHIDYLTKSKTVGCIEDALYFYRINENSLSLAYDPNRFERIKKMHLLVYDKLSTVMDVNRFKEIEEGWFLSYARGQIVNAVRKKNVHSIKGIKLVVEDELLQQVIHQFPYHKNLTGRRFFNTLVAHKCTYGLYVVIKLQQVVKH